jgi:hypothetical protein
MKIDWNKRHTDVKIAGEISESCMKTPIHAGYSRVQSKEPAFRWPKANHLAAAQKIEVRIGYGPQTLYYWPDQLIAQAPPPKPERKAAALKAVQTKREKLMAWIKLVDIQIEAPTSLKQLAIAAIANRNDYRAYHPSGDLREDFVPAKYWSGCESDPDVMRWMRNYLRHQLSSYENTLYRLYGKTGVEKAYRLLRRRIDSKIEAVIKELKGGGI